MNNITLKQMRYFATLARLGHFGYAADASAISQPALSQQIKKLEQELGTPLFERGAKSFVLTRFGQEFLAQCHKILEDVQTIELMARAARQDAFDRLNLGIIPTIAPYLLPKILRAMSDSHPEITVSVRETQTSKLVEETLNGSLDMALLALPIGEAHLEETVMFSEEFVLVRPQTARDLPVPDPRSFAALPWLLLEEGHCFRDQALAFCQIDTTANRRHDASSLSTLVQMVQADLGITLIPDMAIDLETRATDVNVARFPTDPPTRDIGAIWRKSSPLAHKFATVFQTMTQAVTPS